MQKHLWMESIRVTSIRMKGIHMKTARMNYTD